MLQITSFMTNHSRWGLDMKKIYVIICSWRPMVFAGRTFNVNDFVLLWLINSIFDKIKFVITPS